MRNRLSRLLVIIVTALGGACTVHQTDVPGLTGPSTVSHSLTINLSPTTISQDGVSTSQVKVTAVGPNGPEVQTVRLDMLVGGALANGAFGALSAQTITTGSNGIATATFTAPPASPSSVLQTVNTVSIRASLTGSDAQSSLPVTEDLKLVPLGVIIPVGDNPAALFTVAPQPVSVNVTSTFDASTSCPVPVDASGNCFTTATSSQSIVSFDWDFGDCVTKNGKVVTHSFKTPCAFTVILTVTNDRGLKSRKTLGVLIGAPASATGDWVSSPANPAVGDTVLFNADTIVAPPGRTLVQFSWNFGDPASASNTASGSQATHKYTVAGSYNSVLTVTDDIGQTTSITHSILVGTGAPLATFAASPAAGVHTMTFDASGSTALGGATITSYQWSFGDGAFAGPSGSPTVSHSFPAAGTFTVTLTVTDSLGRTGIFSASVTVS